MPGKFLTLQSFIDKANKKHKFLYDYSLSVYTGSKNNVKIICAIHGIFEQRASGHMGGNICPKCSKIIQAKEFTLDNDYVISQATKKHGNKFDYSLLKYTNNKIKVKIICNKHNIIFEQRYNHHLEGDGGCPECFKEFNRKKAVKSVSDFIKECNIIHHNKYDYSLTVYTNHRNKVKVICPIHNSFLIIAHNHVNDAGCPMCGKIDSAFKQTLTLDEFIKRANDTHNNKYDYSKSKYKGAFGLVTIICKKHGKFKQRASVHLKGHGCSSCTKTTSNIEITWLDSLKIPTKYRQGRLKIGNKFIKPDAYDPITNTIYEFYGDFWHGNPKIYNANDINNVTKTTFGELYAKTINKEKIIIKAGFKLISIWENCFRRILNNNPISAP